jgi:hypothetical protein
MRITLVWYLFWIFFLSKNPLLIEILTDKTRASLVSQQREQEKYMIEMLKRTNSGNVSNSFLWKSSANIDQTLKKEKEKEKEKEERQ